MENKKNSFSEWYNEIIEIAELSDKRYSIKGMNVWLPSGLRMMQSMDSIVRQELDSLEFREVSFPLLISREQLEVEFEHFKGFEDQLFWVTRGGKEPLEVDLALRPTSEVAMYPMFSLWVRTHADLPLKTYQIVNTFRYETKHTRPFIRVREIHFIEAHTAHATFEDAEKELEEYDSVFRKLCGKILVPVMRHRRPDWDKFPGAKYSIAYDAVMPGGRTLQIGTIHQYGDNFARTYNIEYTDENGERQYASQTTYGMSERLLASVIGIHGDDTGLIVPPAIAPVQVVIVAIPPVSQEMSSFVSEIMDVLKSKGYRVKYDDRDNYTPGYKYNDWEMRGIPLRIEIGKREASGRFLTVAYRTGGKMKIDIGDLGAAISGEIRRVEEEIYARAEGFQKNSVKFENDVEGIISFDGVSRAYWCGSKECVDRIEENSNKNCLGTVEDDGSEGPCVVCGKPGRLSSFSRTY